MVNSVRFVLGAGVAVLIAASVGLVGAIGLFGATRSALEITRTLQDQRTQAINDRLTAFFGQIEQDVFALVDLLQNASENLDEERVVALLTAFLRHKPQVTDLTVVRRDGSNLMAWREDEAEPAWERDGDLGAEAIEIAIRGEPGDGLEGFEDVYFEPEDQRPVVSYTKYIRGPNGDAIGVLFLDLDITSLSRALSDRDQNQTDYAFLFDASGQVLAHPALADLEAYARWDRVPTVADIGDPLVAAVSERVGAVGAALREIETAEDDWLLSIAVLDGVGDSAWYAVDATPRRVVLGPALERARIIALVGAIVLVFAVALAMRVGRSITRPILRLSSAADEVRSLNISPRSSVPRSAFAELSATEHAFAAMLKALRVFARYAPKSLVLQLMRLEEKSGEIEPDERAVTIVFTDIADFASISAGMSPADLARMLNDYFEAVVAPILEADGTVDKFIGDALMAFWNAPVRQDDHVDRALAAALQIRVVTDRINARRQEAGERPLITRIGVHTGRVLVGDIGANERLNYTIIGDAVNATARLEALGKQVGETLCVSGETRAASNADYAWRAVGQTRLRGRDTDTAVFTIDRADEDSEVDAEVDRPSA